MKTSHIYVIIVLSCFSIAHAQSPALSSASNFEMINRHISIGKPDGKNVVHLDAADGAGVAWLKNIKFSTGTIEFDVKGRDVMQQSFVGIAFHGTSDAAYDCIYFRPFNFNTPGAARKSHSVQYISMPQYDWQYLREKFPNKYENALTNSVDADVWFHAKVVVTANEIKVFVNNSTTPSLTVEPLNNYTKGKVGFWVGNGSDGDFSNLIIQKNERVK